MCFRSKVGAMEDHVVDLDETEVESSPPKKSKKSDDDPKSKSFETLVDGDSNLCKIIKL